MCKNVNRLEIICYILLLAYLKPINVTLIEELDYIYKIVKIIGTVALVMFIFNRQIRISKSTWLYIIFLLVWQISIVLNTGTLGAYLQEMLSILGILLLREYLKTFENGIFILLKVIHYISKVYILLNFVTVVLDRPLFASPEVDYVKYFLGSDNYSAFILIVLCGFLFTYDFVKCNKISGTSWLISFLGLLSLTIPYAVTGMFSYGLFLILAKLINYSEVKKFFSVKNTIIISSMFLCLVLIFNIQEHLGMLLASIGKVGLNSREIIWPFTVKAVMEKPWIGYGTLTQAQTDSYLLYGVSHAHNIFLEILLKTGVLGSVIMICIGKLSFGNSYKSKSKYMICLRYCMVAFLMCSIFDFYIGLIYFWLLLIVIDTLDENETKARVNNNKILKF